MASTIYDVKLRYFAEDRATRRLRHLRQEMERVNRSSRLLRRSLAMATTGVATYFGLHKATDMLIGFNSRLEQASNTMAGMLALNVGGSMTDHLGNATQMVLNLQQRAKESIGTTADMVEMAQRITRAVVAAGLSMEDLENITHKAVVAARAFNIHPDMASLDIEQALMGTLTKRDRFARALLLPLGFDTQDFNKLSARDRAETLKKAFNQPALKEMAARQAKTFMGAWTTFLDQLEIFMGKVGLPLFTAMTEHLNKWNAWIDNNADKMDKMAKSLADNLMSAFNAIKGIAKFFVQHASTLIGLTKAWLAFKIGKGVSGMAATGIGAVGFRMRQAGALGMAMGADRGGLGLAKMGVQFGRVSRVLTGFVPAIGMATIALSGLFDIFQRRAAEERRREIERKKIESVVTTPAEAIRAAEATNKKITRMGSMSPSEFRKNFLMENAQKLGSGPDAFFDAVRRFAGVDTETMRREKLSSLEGNYKSLTEVIAAHDMKVAVMASKYGLLNEETGKVIYGLTSLTDPIHKLITEFELTEKQARDLVTAVRDMEKRLLPSQIQALLGTTAGPGYADMNHVAQKPEVNVTIERIEVASEDPDRFVFGLTEALADVAKNPSAARAALREG